jgi:hypothetical protein
MRRASRTLAAAALAAAMLAIAAAGSSAAQTRLRGPDSAVLTIGHTAGRAVPRSFLGLATEYDSVPLYGRYPRLLGRVLSQLTPADGSPLLLRIGGLSADDSLWGPALTAALPAKARALTPADLAGIAALIRAEHLQVILDLNLAADVPAQEADLAAAAQRALPAGSIEAFEIGNEPDYYRVALRGDPAYYPTSYSPALYASRFLSYASALHRTVPGVTLAGPALANPVADFGYLTDLVGVARGRLGMLTVHRYALSACAAPAAPLYPTITRLLRPSASIGLADTLRRSVALAHANHMSIRWDELNSVTCGGTLGVSDSFASALWATDTLFAALRVGIDGVNVQMRPTALNAPFYLTAAGVQARPLLYGLVLFNQALGRHAHLLDTRVTGSATAGLSGWAVRTDHRLNVVLLNKGTSARAVLVRGPRTGSATITRMRASSIRTESHVTFAGRHIDAAGRWAGRYVAVRQRRGPGGYRISLAPFSGAMVSFAH